MHLDNEWVRINEDTNLDGERLPAQFARNMRSDGGMVIGRIVRENSSFLAQAYRRGEFSDIAKPFGTFDEAGMALRQNLRQR